MTTTERRPTGADVARLAGVNQASVSRVFAGKAAGRVSPEIEERIREAARTLGYQPHASGRSLRSGQTYALGLVVTDFENPFFGGVSRGAQREALARGRSIVLMEGGVDGDAFLPYRALDAGLVDGLLLFGVDPPQRPTRTPGEVTLIESEYAGHASVVFDAAHGLREAVAQVADFGHRRVAYLGADIDRWTFRRRREAWREVMAEILPDAAVVEASARLDLDAAAAAVRELLRDDIRPTALICADDLLAAGAFRAAAEEGVSIGDELSVVGFGGTIVGEALWPRLSGIVASGARLGAAAVALHLDGDPGHPARTVLDVELVIRDSLGPVPAAA